MSTTLIIRSDSLTVDYAAERIEVTAHNVNPSDVLSQIGTEEIVAWLERNTEVRMVPMRATY